MTTECEATRRRALQIAVALAAIPIAEAVAATPNVVGVWRLVAATATDSDGKKVGVPYGPRGMGIVTLTSDGRMMAVLCDGRPALPEGEPRQFMSYAGNYTFDGQTLSTRVDASSDASRVGGDQVRHVRFENGLMVLAPPRRLYAGVMQHQELAWERIRA